MASLYLKFEGKGASGDLNGEVVRPTYKDQIEILSFSIGASNAGGRPNAKDTHAKGNAMVTPMTLYKVFGPESPGLVKACLNGVIIAKATLTMDASSGKDSEVIVTYVMEHVIISDVSQSGSGGGSDRDIPETISITFDKVTMTHVPSKKMADYTMSTAQ